ncbi:hypothetical protein HOP50_18g82520 [Chloropicon primus]|uniref:TFIIB-type domain-containing protein n=1 Tax=Chloropicon primus TaxID=1764295 RepID=A0A5B8MZC9_9CHLO|nr:hypothetical protein A3770_18p82290 [Chloropicon primus]UPR04907.1 hypothetical protein HOP50_18g82520 [Chloropicon primus]|mmetsp:Transcript_14609/g.41719  ORF Transcript_14609/g.41719 Transcript_14609/m.41719 type:complete len:455 (+) Transcript_14609:413-1777(+)|eukprot:QDZ25711.1 hypothetical protein A3770_18p82290 [Chloropicon primus]
MGGAAAVDFEKMSCPNCGEGPGCLSLDDIESMVSCERCGYVLAESLVSTTGSLNLTYNLGGGRHGFIVKLDQADKDIAKTLNILEKHSSFGHRRGGLGIRSGAKWGGEGVVNTNSSAREVTAFPLRSLREKLGLPPNLIHEVQCLFRELEVPEPLNSSLQQQASTSAMKAEGPKKPGFGGAGLVPRTEEAFVKKFGLRAYSKGDIEVLVGACVYLASRKLHFPLLLENVAEAINTAAIYLRDVSTRLQGIMQLSLPCLDMQELLMKSIGTLKNEGVLTEEFDSSLVLKEFKQRSASLLRFCESKLLTTGKRPLPAIAAILYKSINSEADGEVPLHKISAALKCNTHTCASRAKDIEKALNDPDSYGVCGKRKLEDKLELAVEKRLAAWKDRFPDIDIPDLAISSSSVPAPEDKKVEGGRKGEEEEEAHVGEVDDNEINMYVHKPTILAHVVQRI